MKIIGINGSPHEKGNTYTALAAAGRIFKMKNINFEIFNIGIKEIRGCSSVHRFILLELVAI